MPPIIRRRPLRDRIAAYLNPLDFLLWFSAEFLNGDDWDEFQHTFALPIGVACNVVFLVARANSGPKSLAEGDGVFLSNSGRTGGIWGGLVCIAIIEADE
jgi:hypothetical protein